MVQSLQLRPVSGWGRQKKKDAKAKALGSQSCQQALPSQSSTCEIVAWDPYESPDPKNIANQTTEPEENKKAETEQWAALLPQKNVLCGMCLYAALQSEKGEEQPPKIQKALNETARRYWETGYKEMEKLTLESYALGCLACS